MIANRSTIRGRARSQVISTAWALIAAGGVGSFSMRDVADAADVALGTVTYHFKNREDLVDAALTALALRHVKISDTALRNAKHATREAAPQILGHALLELWGERVTALAGAELRIHASRSAAAQRDAVAYRASGLRVITNLHRALGKPHDRSTIEAVSDLLDAKSVRLAGRHQSEKAFAAAVRRHLDGQYGLY